MAARTISEPKLPQSIPPRMEATGSTAAQQPSRDSKIAGVLLSLAGAAILMGFITAEALYPGVYTTHTNTVSHLGASEPPNSVVLLPSAAIFDLTMLVTGAMILAGAWFAYRALRRKAVLIPTALLGIGVVGVGTFPLTHPAPHTLFAFTAFLAGGLAVLLSAWVTPQPLRAIFAVMGTVSLGFTLASVFLLEWGPFARLDLGGVERWMVYPVLLWLVGFGGYLAARRPEQAPLVSLPATTAQALNVHKERVGSSR